MKAVVLAGLILISATTHAAQPEVDPQLVAGVRGCAQKEATACRELASRLASRLEGGPASESSLGLRLGIAVANAIERPDGMVTGVAESCRAGYPQACVSLARVLDGLFSGDDVRLDRSTDRLLARELAARVMAAIIHSTLSSRR